MEKTSPPKLFDNNRQIAVEARAAMLKSKDIDFLCKEAALAIGDRLHATNREFEIAADLFSPFECMTRPLEASSKTKTIVKVHAPGSPALKTGDIQSESREILNLEPNSINLITSVFSLHRVNDLPGMLTQINRSLLPDGLFMASLPGDRTLNELRTCLLEAESSISNKVSLRIDPFIEVRQAGGLLQRTSFALPVVDSDVLTVRYDDIFALIKDLRAMGATSALTEKPDFGPRELFVKANEIYKEKFADEDGRIRATVEIIYLSGWKPHASQQQPLKPGSAVKSLKDVL